ncbi:MAG: S-layer homology domain-containing protein [Bacillota bacterium]|nr:S-layer homology domain-containing protein [Bacillota bacterium]
MKNFKFVVIVFFLLSQIILLSLNSIVFASDDSESISITINNSNIQIYVDNNPKLVTRAEICRFFVKALDLKPSGENIHYPDVPYTYEYAQDIKTVVANKIMLGYSDGSFKPENSITRVEFAVYLCKILKLSFETDNVAIGDVVRAHWAYSYINTVVNDGLMSLDENNNFRPDDKLSIDFTGQFLPIINAESSEYKKITWKSSNEEVATVDSTGHVTGISPGYAKIICSLEDQGISKTCNVIVKSPQYSPPLFSGNICPNINASKSNFKISAGQSTEYVTTDESGYFELKGNISDIDMPCTIQITKNGYLLKKLELQSFGSISSPDNPINIIAGDVNSDNKVNLSDVIMIAKGFNTVRGQSDYNEVCDLNMDDSINMADVLCIAKGFGYTTETY